MTFHNEDDWPIDEYILTDVTVDQDGGLSLRADSWGFGVTAEEARGKPVPVPGEKVELLGGLGYQIRGIFIGGREYRYVTRVEAEAQRVKWLADYERQKREDFEKNIGDWLRRKNALSGPFYQRIQRFENKDFVEFWKDSGAYELFTVEQANWLYHLAMTKPDPVDWINEFYNADWEDQKVMFPDLDEGHSGNTFGGMVYLARRVASGEEI